jgi:hypothetical protein
MSQRSGQDIPRPAKAFKRTPSDPQEWVIAAQNEFPIFALAEALLEKSDRELVDGWEALPEASAELTVAFAGIGRRWLNGAEAMLFMSQRMQAAHRAYVAETEGGAKPPRAAKQGA